MAGMHEIGVKRADALQHVHELLGLDDLTIVPTKSSPAAQMAYTARLIEELAVRADAQDKVVRALNKRVAALERRPAKG